MGVVHKLQDEIRDFILAQKKSFPQISCRKLSDVVLEKFGIVISKSSISSVLKSAHLSSPIGRHSFAGAEPVAVIKKDLKKFKIPHEKKSQIFPINNPVDVVKQEDLPPQEMSNLKSLAKKEDVSPVIQNQRVLVQNAGTIFLKAIEWKMFGESILAKTLKEELGARFNVDFDKLAYGMLWAQDLGDKKIFEDVLIEAENISNWGMKLSIEAEIFMQSAAYIQLINRDGKKAFFDLATKNVQSENVHSGHEIFVADARNTVINEILRNVHSAVFYCDAKGNNIEKIRNFFISSFGDKPAESIKEIGLYNSQSAQIAKYDFCPIKKRTFILALRFWKESLPDLLDFFMTKPQMASLKILDQVFFYTKCQLKDSLQAIGVSCCASKEPFIVLLTNAVNDEQNTKKAVFDFLLTLPQLGVKADMPVAAFVKEQANFPFVELDYAQSFSESVRAFQNVLKALCQNYFFKQELVGINSEQIYSLPGFLLEENRILSLTFDLAQSDPRFAVLKNAIDRFNYAVVLDPQGRRIILEIRPAAV